MKTNLIGRYDLEPGDLVLLKNISLVGSASGQDHLQYLENLLGSRFNTDTVFFSTVLSVIKNERTTILFSYEGKSFILCLCDLFVSTIRP